MEVCKEYLLHRLNSHFRIDYDGFFYENEKYDFSQIPQFIEEARKFTGYRFKIGFVCDDDSNDFESNEDSHEKEEEEEEEEASNGEDDDENTEQNSEGRSDSETEMNADSEEEEEEEEETTCSECDRQYSSKSNLSRHMKSQH
jgi:cobalamin biosynthesis protein CobT